MLKNRKGLGGPLDLIHSFVLFGVAATMIKFGMNGAELGPTLLLVIGGVIIVSEVLGILM
jgi:hypothetical protein